jgi:DNA-binding response OmpR family regulator
MGPPHITYPLPPMRVLVVDDEADARAALRGLLRIWGHEVCEAANAEEALRLAADFRPEVLLVNLKLPEGDGVALGTRLRELPGLDKLAVVLLAGRPDEEELQKASQAGTCHYLIKPPNPILLRSLLGSIRYTDVS